MTATIHKLPSRGKILWLHGSQFTPKIRAIGERFMRAPDVALSPGSIAYASIHRKVRNMWRKKGKSFTWNPDASKDFEQVLDLWIKATKAKVIVINDPATLGFITREYISLDLCRGSVYYWKGIPCIVVDNLIKTQFNLKRQAKESGKVEPKKYSPWILTHDLQKIKRFANDNVRSEPKFNLTVVSNRSELDSCFRFLYGCKCVAEDIETSHGFITCIGFSGVTDAGIVRTFVVPFIDTTKPGNAYWPTEEDEAYAWTRIRDFHKSEVIKIFQNGSYDSAYLVKYNIPLRNYLLDTQHLFHSIWCEAPKRLNFIASLLVDHYVFWKDEAKGDKKDKSKSEFIPFTAERLKRYWKYNGLDTYFTLLNAIRLVEHIATIPWARRNFSNEFGAEIGPAFAASMRGFRMHPERLGAKLAEWNATAAKALSDLRVMVDDPDYNPRSSHETASFLYDVLGATPLKNKKSKTSARSVNKDLLKFVRLQHPLFAIFIDKLNAYKEAINNVSKYAMLEYMHRWMYKLNAGGTETGRYSSSQHQFRLGTQVQNVPESVRDVCIADDGYFFLEFDYAQSDAWFVGYESQDPTMVELVNGERDSHCVVATWFFNREYDEIYSGYKQKLPWVVHPVRGVRQNTKRLRHGANYRMQGDTLYHHLGHDETIATAVGMGFTDAWGWDKKKLVNFCQNVLLKRYYKKHPGLPIWFRASADECARNGNIASCYGGHTRYFFGNVKRDGSIQRELSAYFGQGGTGGNINLFIRDFYYKQQLEKEGCLFMTQTHDSVLIQIPIEKPELVDKILTMAARECIVKGQTFVVPVDASIGFSWKGGMLPYTGSIDFNALREADNDWHEQQYKQAA